MQVSSTSIGISLAFRQWEVHLTVNRLLEKSSQAKYTRDRVLVILPKKTSSRLIYWMLINSIVQNICVQARKAGWQTCKTVYKIIASPRLGARFLKN